MTEQQIIEGLLIYFDNVEINVMTASKKMGGYKNYKKFEKALNSAYSLTEAK